MIHFVDEGPRDAPAVLLVHSLGTDHTLWDAQAAALRARWRVVRPDLRGHGASGTPPEPWALADLAADVLGVADRLSLARFHVVGLSVGGQVAMWLAAHAAPRVGRLVVADSAAQLGTASGWDARIAAVAAGGVAAIVDGVLERALTARCRAAAPDLAARLRARILATPAAGYLATCRVLRDADLRADVAGITAPALILAGRHDVTTTVDDAGWLASRIPGARLVELDGAHLSNLEAESDFTAALVSFLSEEPPWTSATGTTKG